MGDFLLKASKRIKETKPTKSLLIILFLFFLGLSFPLNFNLAQGDFLFFPSLYISDSPDPFNPYFEKSEISAFPFFFSKEGNPIPCDKLTFTIKGTGKTWEWENTFGEIVKWDGKDEKGDLVPPGNYLYEVVCDYTFNGQPTSESATGTITVLPTKERFPYY